MIELTALAAPLHDMERGSPIHEKCRWGEVGKAVRRKKLLVQCVKLRVHGWVVSYEW